MKPASIAVETPSSGTRLAPGLRSLRAKATLALVAVVAYFVAAAAVLSVQRAATIRVVEDLETLYQAESTLARVNTFVSQTKLKINEAYFTTEPERIVRDVELDVDSIKAGLGGLAGWYPRAAAMTRRLQAALDQARVAPTRGAILDLRASLRELARDLEQIARETRARHDRMWSGYFTNYDTVTLTAALLFFLGLAIFGGVGMMFFRRLAWDLQLLSDRAIEVVRGYRGEALRVTRADEVGTLIDSVNRMQHIMREREQQIEVARQQRFHQEKMVAIGSLAAAVAHEINNPIAAIEGVAQSIAAARHGACPDGGAGCHPELILEHTRRIVGITRQLSGLTGPQSTEPEWTDLNALTRATCTFVTYDARFREVKMELALDSSIPAVWVVADHVTQVLMNLLINAADALKGRPGERRIAVATAPAGDFVRLTVSDTAGGMPAEVAKRAFEEGFTTKADGSGIGLFMCKTLVERGGGRIALESGGGGTEVRILLPVQSTMPEGPR